MIRIFCPGDDYLRLREAGHRGLPPASQTSRSDVHVEELGVAALPKAVDDPLLIIAQETLVTVGRC